VASGTTASGEDMDDDRIPAAYPTLPLGSEVKIENLKNGRAVVVRMNDRGPLAKDRIKICRRRRRRSPA
jgi:rare lipoprotein A